MEINRQWHIAKRDTLQIKPIERFVKKWIKHPAYDPFARNCTLCDVTNDLNPETSAQYHEFAEDFLRRFKHMPFVLFDPPYSLSQAKECYQSYGVPFLKHESCNVGRWTPERNLIAERQNAGDIVISLGWSTVCMGKKRGYEIKEILLVPHGPAKNDTICVVESKL